MYVRLKTAVNGVFQVFVHIFHFYIIKICMGDMYNKITRLGKFEKKYFWIKLLENKDFCFIGRY